MGTITAAIEKTHDVPYAERFWAKVTVGHEDVCWEWKAAGDKVGDDQYGKVKLPRSRVTERAHRVAYFLGTGIDPSKGVVMHSCDNQRCCNPAHLVLGTHADNMEDMRNKKRAKNGDNVGERNPRAVLSENAIGIVRELLDEGVTNLAIGEMFGVHHSTISALKRGLTWQDAI